MLDLVYVVRWVRVRIPHSFVRVYHARHHGKSAFNCKAPPVYFLTRTGSWTPDPAEARTFPTERDAQAVLDGVLRSTWSPETPALDVVRLIQDEFLLPISSLFLQAVGGA